MAVIRVKDYHERIRELISNLYDPATVEDYDIRKTTAGIYHDLCSIIPENAFDEYDVLEALEELNFIPGYEQKARTFENEKGEEITEIYDDVMYFWYMKKKKS